MSEVTGALYANISASGSVKATPGKVFGVIVNSHASGTLKLWDNTAGSGTVILNTYTFPAGSQSIVFAEPIVFNNGLFATIGGTADITVLYK